MSPIGNLGSRKGRPPGKLGAIRLLKGKPIPAVPRRFKDARENTRKPRRSALSEIEVAWLPPSLGGDKLPKGEKPIKEATPAFAHALFDTPVPLEVMAAVLGLSPDNIRKLLAKDSAMSAEVGQQFYVAKCVQEYISFVRYSGNTPKSRMSKDVDSDKKRLTKAQADLKERQFKVLEGEYLERVAVEKAWSETLGLVRQAILSMCDVLAPQVQDCEQDLESIREAIRAFGDALLRDLANTPVDYIDNAVRLPEEEEDELAATG